MYCSTGCSHKGDKTSSPKKPPTSFYNTHTHQRTHQHNNKKRSVPLLNVLRGCRCVPHDLFCVPWKKCACTGTMNDMVVDVVKWLYLIRYPVRHLWPRPCGPTQEQRIVTTSTPRRTTPPSPHRECVVAVHSTQLWARDNDQSNRTHTGACVKIKHIIYYTNALAGGGGGGMRCATVAVMAVHVHKHTHTIQRARSGLWYPIARIMMWYAGLIMHVSEECVFVCAHIRAAALSRMQKRSRRSVVDQLAISIQRSERACAYTLMLYDMHQSEINFNISLLLAFGYLRVRTIIMPVPVQKMRGPMARCE